MGYLEALNFSNYPQPFADEIQEEIKRNWRSPFIQNFKKNYEDGNIPLYAAVEIFSFGTLSKFYKNMLVDDKRQLRRHMVCITLLLKAVLRALLMSETCVRIMVVYIMPNFQKHQRSIVKIERGFLISG